MGRYVPGRLRFRRRSEGWFERGCAETFVPEEVEILAGWGVVQIVEGRAVWPGDGTLAVLWRERGSAILETGAGDEFERWRMVRRALCVPPGPADDVVLRRVIDLGRGKVGEQEAAYLLGPRVARASLPRLRELDGTRRKRPGPVRRGTLEDLLEILPEDGREAVRAGFRREVIPAIKPPLATHVGRVIALRGGPARLLGACMLLKVALDRRTPASGYDIVSRIERFDDLTADGDQRCAGHVTTALDAYVRGEARPGDPERARNLAASLLGRDVSAAGAWALSALGAAGEELVRALPAVHSGGRTFAAALRKAVDAGDAASREVKVAKIASIVPRSADLLVAVENRTAFLEDAMARFLKALPAARGSAERGLRAGFDCLGPVLRPDGALGVGRQIVSWEIVREDELMRRAVELDPGDPSAAAMEAMFRYDPSNRERLHLVYLGTRPEIKGGEHHEPWVIDLFRCGAIGNGAGLSPELRARRRELLAGMGSPDGLGTPMGLLGADHHSQWAAQQLRSSDPEGRRVIVPLLEFLHAMLLARIVFRMGARWGARLGETRQLRSGCISTEILNGRPELVASMKPKGWDGDGLFAIDESTVRALIQLKEIAHHRWFPGCFDEKGDPSVPIIEFREGSRNDLAPARYLLCGSRGMVRSDDLLKFLRVLLQGVVSLGSHDGRYLFATALGLRGEDYAEIGGCLHHSSGSDMPERYDLSGHVTALQGAKAFNAHLDASEIGRISR